MSRVDDHRALALPAADSESHLDETFALCGLPHGLLACAKLSRHFRQEVTLTRPQLRGQSADSVSDAFRVAC